MEASINSGRRLELRVECLEEENIRFRQLARKWRIPLASFTRQEYDNRAHPMILLDEASGITLIIK